MHKAMHKHIQKLKQKSQSSISATNDIPRTSQKSLIFILKPVRPKNKIINAEIRAVIII